MQRWMVHSCIGVAARVFMSGASTSCADTDWIVLVSPPAARVPSVLGNITLAEERTFFALRSTDKLQGLVQPPAVVL
ncbi:hypothetical protein FKP32DRAFT_1230694 [Trametes sanguinea]|nr:hypothetical protein FKP32DRAFT_1230694 [Trametes sanguinea]